MHQVRNVRFGLVLNDREWVAISRLAEMEDTSKASFIRRFIYEEAKTNGLWPDNKVKQEASK